MLYSSLFDVFNTCQKNKSSHFKQFLVCISKHYDLLSRSTPGWLCCAFFLASTTCKASPPVQTWSSAQPVLSLALQWLLHFIRLKQPLGHRLQLITSGLHLPSATDWCRGARKPSKSSRQGLPSRVLCSSLPCFCHHRPWASLIPTLLARAGGDNDSSISPVAVGFPFCIQGPGLQQHYPLGLHQQHSCSNWSRELTWNICVWSPPIFAIVQMGN